MSAVAEAGPDLSVVKFVLDDASLELDVAAESLVQTTRRIQAIKEALAPRDAADAMAAVAMAEHAVERAREVLKRARP